MALSTTISSALNKKIDELWFTNTRDYAANVTHSKSTWRILLMLMHLSAGHITLLQAEFHPQISSLSY